MMHNQQSGLQTAQQRILIQMSRSPITTPLCLATDGLSQICVSEGQSDVVSRAFDSVSRAMDLLSSSCSEINGKISAIPILDDAANSYNCTGYHPFGGSLSSRYNKDRQGFVFSNGEIFSFDEQPSFEQHMRDVRNELDGIALKCLASIEERLGLPKGYFLQVFGLGGKSLMEYSQWHIKRYRKINPDDDSLLLPVHTDPSILSIIVHDAPGICDGGWGLEYATKLCVQQNAKITPTTTTKWMEIPSHGHGIATVMMGAAFGRIMQAGGPADGNNYEDVDAGIRKLYPPIRHRVRNIPSSSHRMAITYFLRPAPASVLQPLPIFKETIIRCPKPMRFDDWYKRVSSRYGKSSTTETQNNKKHNTNSPPTSIVLPRLTHDTDEGGPKCYLLYPADSALVGREQYLGGELGLADGHVYAIPGCARRVLKINPDDDSITKIGPSYDGEYKWLRSVQTRQGIVYGLPCHADSVLRIDTNTGNVTTIGCNLVDSCIGRRWKYHGGAISPIDGCIYCIPTCADQVLKIDPRTDEVFLIGGPFLGENKWYGALLGKDGAVYGIPHNAPGVIRVDPSSDPVVTIHGNFPEGGHKWHGGVVAPNGSIIGIPANANTILKIDPCQNVGITEFSDATVIRSGSHRSDGKYKFLGAAVGQDGHVYFIPSDAERVVQVDVERNIAREVGRNLTSEEPIRNNKWQGGFLSKIDGAIYAIPLKAQTVLRVQTCDQHSDPSLDNEPIVSTIGGFFTGLNKWEGGVLAKNGSMYCMPLNCKAVLKVSPGQK